MYFDISDKKLNHILYSRHQQKYFTFNVKKRDGSSRTINSPIGELKELQFILKEDLLKIFGTKSCVHGFVKSRNILTNAKNHLNKKILVNLDLQDFFTSIHFGRVYGLFLSKPFNFPKIIATLLAQICCCEGLLPQGAPTSPIISNFICRKLDNDLIKHSKNNNFYYSRYADDITISCNKNHLPKELGTLKNNIFTASSFISDIISSNDFILNFAKVRVAFSHNRQSVNGIKVNKILNVDRLYIKQIRATLNACEKYGVTNAALVHFKKNEINSAKLKNPIDFFLKRLVGKIAFIAFVRGKDDFIFEKLYKRIKAIVPDARLSIIYKKIENATDTLILTEGKTDWKHIKSAFQKFQKLGLYENVKLNFADYLDEHKVSNGELLKICQTMPIAGMQPIKVICIFDRDDLNFIPKVTSTSKPYKDWTNNVFSMVLPVPDHRNFDSVCIEHFYNDDDLLTYDSNNRRIFLSSEFDLSGKHKIKSYLFKGAIAKLQSRFPLILDANIIDSVGESIALSKNDFANYIYEDAPRYNSFYIEAFKAIINQIILIKNLN